MRAIAHVCHCVGDDWWNEIPRVCLLCNDAHVA
jgi:hypothetical protein